MPVMVMTSLASGMFGSLQDVALTPVEELELRAEKLMTEIVVVELLPDPASLSAI